MPILIRPIPNYRHYLVSTNGSVWQTRFINGKTNKLLKTPIKLKPKFRQGYPAVALWKRGARKDFNVHTLILETFVCPRPKWRQARHKDGDRRNCRLSNLEWTTAAQNSHDKYKHGTMTFGSKSGTSHLTDDDAIEIRRLSQNGWSTDILATHYRIHPATARRIISGFRWRHLLEDKP